METKAILCVLILLSLHTRSVFAVEPEATASTPQPDSTASPPDTAPETPPQGVVTPDVSASSIAPPVESMSPCAKVACSSHGVCVLLKGEPSCACDEGFVPDTVNGLNCIPSSSQQQPTVAKQKANADLIDPSVRAVDRLLPGYPTDRIYQRYLWLTKVGRFSGTFPEFVESGFRTKKIRGAILLGAGVAVTALSVLSFVFGIIQDQKWADRDSDCYRTDSNGNEYNDCEINRNLLYVFGGIFAAGSVALYTVGGLMLGRASHRTRLLRQLKEKPQPVGTLIPSIDISPVWDRNRNFHGVAARIRF